MRVLGMLVDATIFLMTSSFGGLLVGGIGFTGRADIGSVFPSCLLMTTSSVVF